MVSSFLFPLYVQGNDFLSSLVFPRSRLVLSFYLTCPFSSSLSFLLFFPAQPQAGAEGPKASLLWLHMHSFKASF